MDEQQLNFIRKDFIEKAKTLKAEQMGKWGKMNAQQMVEHMTYSMRFANGVVNHKPMLPQELLDKTRSFFLSEKLFREGTRNALLPEDPDPIRNASMEEAIKELQVDIETWISLFKDQPNKTTTNPFAGEFTFDEWGHLFHKHFMHHARQFGLVE